MNRRNFLRCSAILAAGAVAADQVELLDRLGWTRSLFASAPVRPTLWGDGVHDDTAAFQALVDGREVFDARRNVLYRTDDHVLLSGGWHRLTATVVVGEKATGRRLAIRSSVFEGPRGGGAFEFRSPAGRRLVIANSVESSHT